MMKNSEIFIEDVKRGEKGLSKGIPFTHDTLTDVIGGITKNTYFLILGKSKSGKSSFLYDQFIFNSIDRAILNEDFGVDDLEIYLYSFEISASKIYAKAASRYLFIKHNIITSPKQILGMKGPAHKILYDKLYSKEMEYYLNVVDKTVNIITTSNPIKMYNLLYKKCKEQSKIIGIDGEGKDIYQFKNKNKKFIIGVDHMSLVRELKGKKLKQTVDLMSNEVLRALKEQFPITSVLIQQITPTGEPKLFYGHDNARDTKNTFQDSDVTMSINSPFHEGFEAVDYMGSKYFINDISGSGKAIGDNLRLISIEKDRLGNSGYRLPVGFIGQMGVFKKIDNPKKLNYDDWVFVNTYKNG